MHPNIQILTSAANSLGELTNDLVFLGGCATGLLITDPAAPEIRVTRDVDAIAQITTRMEYYQLADQLRACGFHESQEDGAPLCRWENAEVILDVMPTNENILGFSNPWYEGAIQTAEMVSLPTGETIKLASPAYFLATKLAAFYGRGRGDFLMSHDIEDIVAVLDGRPEIVMDIQGADNKVRQYLSEQFTVLLNSRDFVEAITGHLPADSASQKRVSLLVERIRQFQKG